MSGDVCRSKNIEVEVQENGLIRDAKGWAMGRLSDDYPYGDVAEKAAKPLRWHEMPFVPGFIIGGVMLVAFVLGVSIGHVAAMDQPCAARCQIPESIR